jgi:threonine/homoserine/homoserine lactone efflux protein
MNLLQYLLPGFSFGLAAGISPGPLLTLVITETLAGGWKRGIRIALAPVLTDGPIIIAAALLVGFASSLNFFLGTISFAGALFLLYIGYQSLRTTHGLDVGAMPKDQTSSNRSALVRGIVTNYLNPAPYVFHFTVAGPLVARAFTEHLPFYGIIFLLGFFGAIVGAKIIVALVIDRSRKLIAGKTYVWLMRALGAVLIYFAVQNALVGVRYLLSS